MLRSSWVAAALAALAVTTSGCGSSDTGSSTDPPTSSSDASSSDGSGGADATGAGGSNLGGSAGGRSEVGGGSSAGGGTTVVGSGGAGGSPAARALIGFVPGAGVNDPVMAASAFGDWMDNGTGVEVVTDYGYPSVASTTRMTQLGGSKTPANRRGPLTKSSGATPLVFSTSLTPSGHSLDSVVAGQDDAIFTTEAQNMKAYGFTNVIWRLGWECDGHNFTWAIYTGAHNAADVAARAGKFAQAFRRVVGLIRAVDPHARFEYNSGHSENPIPNTNPTQYFPANDPATAYPGDAYVDFIGTDNYGSDYHSYDYQHHVKGTPEQIWQESLGPLSSMKAFADSRHKPFVVSEWGMMIRADGHGSNDSAYFMSHAIAWLNENTYYHTYFNANDRGDHGPTIAATSGGATSLKVSDASELFDKSPDSPVAFFRYGSGTHVRQIDYQGRSTSTNVVSGIPAAGHFGSVPSGGIPAGTPITAAIQNMCQIAIGTNDDDIVEGDHGFRSNPDLKDSAQAFLDGVR